MMILALISTIALIIGGVLWLLMGFFNWNLVSALFGTAFVARAIYIVIGAAALFMVYYLIMQSINANSKNKKRTPAKRTTSAQQ